MNTTQAHPGKPAATSRFAVVAGTAAVSVAIVAIVALASGGGFRGRTDAGGVVTAPSADPSTKPESSPTTAPEARPSAKPEASADAKPAATPASTGSPSQSPVPSADAPGTETMPSTVQLRNATGADVYVKLVDRTGLLTWAKSGVPGDGMSVEPYTLGVENLDATTVKVTWVDFPIDNVLTLYIDRIDAGYRLLMIQPELDGPSDAVGFDRELVLTFSEPISARGIETFLQGGLDTAR